MGCNCNKNNPPSGLTQQNLINAHAERNRREGDVNPQAAKINNPKTPKTPSLIKKAANFTKSVVSRGVSNRRADAVAKRLRVLSCHGHEDQINSPCPYRKESNKKRNTYFCDACGCGDNSQTWLNNPGHPEAFTKLDYPWLSCPMGMPGFSDYIPHSEETDELKEKYGDSLERKKIIENIARVESLKIPAATPKPSDESSNESEPEQTN